MTPRLNSFYVIYRHLTPPIKSLAPPISETIGNELYAANHRVV